ncbi:MAG: hypothetical protein KAQ71_07180, partial [Desulfobulbaceae bacterium]|nr:hypothetical protein [Desulfobulbaceae bacterium]
FSKSFWHSSQIHLSPFGVTHNFISLTLYPFFYALMQKYRSFAFKLFRLTHKQKGITRKGQSLVLSFRAGNESLVYERPSLNQLRSNDYHCSVKRWLKIP